MRKLLTAKQRAVFDFVRQKIYEGLPPSVRKVAAHQHLLAIRRKGYIRWEVDRPLYWQSETHGFH